MKISPINNMNGTVFTQNRNNEKVNFKAKLNLLNDAKSAVPAESIDRFTKVMDSFEKRLAEDSHYPDDVVEVGESISKSFIPTSTGYEKANLRLTISNATTDFFYNIKRTVDEISNDLYNTYKYVSHQNHQANDNNFMSKINSTNEYMNYIYARK